MEAKKAKFPHAAVKAINGPVLMTISCGSGIFNIRQDFFFLQINHQDTELM